MTKIFHHYDVIGLERRERLTLEGLKTAYKKAVRLWHPDLNPQRLEEATDKFKEIGNAYVALLSLLDKEGGEVKASILNAKEFFSQFGFDHLAEITHETLVEINLERAAGGLLDEKSGTYGGTALMVDAKLMKKMLLWARGPDFKAGVTILDHDGHFTNEAIVNILDYAVLYETADTKEKKKSLFAAFFEEDADFEAEERDLRLAAIIRDWVHENYAPTHNDGYIHRSKLAYWRGKLKKSVKDVLSSLDVEDSVQAGVLSDLSGDDFEGAALRLSNYFHSMGGNELINASAKGVAASAKKAQARIDEELAQLGKRLKMKEDEVVEMVKRGGEDEHPLLPLFSERVKTLLSEKEAIDDILSLGGSAKAKVANALITLIADLRALALKAS